MRPRRDDAPDPRVRELLRAAGAPARPGDQLPGEDAALAAFRERSVPATSGSPRRLGHRWGVAAAGLGLVVTGGAAAAASTGSLPDPAQHLAHEMLEQIGVTVPDSPASVVSPTRPHFLPPDLLGTPPDFLPGAPPAGEEPHPTEGRRRGVEPSGQSAERPAPPAASAQPPAAGRDTAPQQESRPPAREAPQRQRPAPSKATPAVPTPTRPQPAAPSSDSKRPADAPSSPQPTRSAPERRAAPAGVGAQPEPSAPASPPSQTGKESR